MARLADEVGARVRSAREDAGLTQQVLADSVGMDRSSLAKVEAGARKVSALELASIADELDVRIEWFLYDAPSAVVSRRNSREPGAPSPTIDRFAERVAREVEFVTQHDPELARLSSPGALPRPASHAAVEEAAHAARRLLGADAEGPLLELSQHAESVGLLAFAVNLGPDAADGASLMLQTGGIAVVNGSRPVGRRRLTLAHELGHYLFADAFSVDWQVSDGNQSDIREARIDRFARAVLLPGRALRDQWSQYSRGGRDVRETSIHVASEYCVDMSTLARRLAELRIVTAEEARAVRMYRTTRADIVDFDLVVRDELKSPQLPRRYEEAVLRLYRRELISAPRAIDLLMDTWDEPDLPALSTLPLQAMWSFVS